MKKYIITILTCLLVCACNIMTTPTMKVQEYLNNFNSLNENVIQDLESVIMNENLTTENTGIYREVLKRQYKDLRYEIVEEDITKDNAIVKVKVTVYDLYNIGIESDNYMNEHQDEFIDENNLFDQSSYMKYKLNQMLNTKDTITHDISFNLTKQDDEWVINDIDRETLEKLHGLYNYNLD